MLRAALQCASMRHIAFLSTLLLASTAVAQTPDAGRQVYAQRCAGCHGSDGNGGQKAGSVTDGSFLALVSDQALRSAVICGRSDLGMPDWRNDVVGRPMSDAEITDVVAWMVAKRPKFPGQPYTN